MEDKTMKKTIITLAAIAAAAVLLSGCQKEGVNSINDSEGKVFTASIEQNLTKTVLTGEYKTNWESSDKININGAVYSTTPDGGDATKATFTKDSGTDPTPTYKAIYPASLYVTDHLELPATQTFAAGKLNAPMYAESETTNLSFKNICSVLAITVDAGDLPAEGKVKKIKVRSDKQMYGTFTATAAGVLSFTTPDDSKNTIVLDCGDTGADPGTFYIAIPPQTYAYFNIYLSTDGSTYKECMATKKAAGLGAIARNRIFNIAYEKNAVQLWSDGLYWATCNLGASSPEKYGGYYQWAGKTDVSNTSFNLTWGNCPYHTSDISYSDWTKYNTISSYGTVDNKTELDLEDDAANVTLGGNWRMPTRAEWEDLINNCPWTKTDNYNGTGKAGRIMTSNKTGYTDKSIFLPAAGCRRDTDLIWAGSFVYYWSSSLAVSGYLNDPSYARIVYFNSVDFGIGNDYRYTGFPIRPVLQ